MLKVAAISWLAQIAQLAQLAQLAVHLQINPPGLHGKRSDCEMVDIFFGVSHNP